MRTSIEPPLFRKLSRMIVDVPAGSRVKTVVPKRLCLFCYAGYYARVTDPARPPSAPSELIPEQGSIK